MRKNLTLVPTVPNAYEIETKWEVEHGQLVEQALRLKYQNRYAILFFRMSRDWYAVIGDDARPVARALGLPVIHDDETLGLGVPVVRISRGKSEDAFQALLAMTYAIAIAEIVEDPEAALPFGREPRRDVIRICRPDYSFAQ